MLASSMEDNQGNPVSLDDLKYPLMASVKLDGIRALTIDGSLLSRSFKPIPNRYIQSLSKDLPNGLDGELVVVGKEFSDTSSGVMSRDGEPNFEYHVFDFVSESIEEPFKERSQKLAALKLPSFCKKVPHLLVNSAAELRNFEEQVVNDGHEGVMVRGVYSPYKCGRSSLKEHYLIKIKRFADSEAEIVSMEEKLHNINEASKDELGHTKRSSSKSGLVPADTLGTLIVKDIYSGLQFGIGTGKGLDDVTRKLMWDNKSQFIGKIIKYRYQEVGKKDLPRIPSFQGFRDKLDMG
jgi:DNA ligase-1